MANRENIDPTTLVKDIAKPRLVNSTIISFAIHFVLLGLLSIGFIGECIKYKSTHPKAVIQQLEKERAEAEKQKKQEEATKLAQLKAKKQAEEQEAKKEAAPAKQEAAPAKKEAAPAAKKNAKDPYANQTANPDEAKMNDADIGF